MKRNRLNSTFRKIGNTCLTLLLLTATFLVHSGKTYAADGDLIEIGLYDSNGNGKIETVDVKIDNSGAKTAHVVTNAGWSVTYAGNNVSVTNVAIIGLATANPQVFRLTLNESDTDLLVDTTVTNFDVTYTQQGAGAGSWHNAATEEVLTIATGATEVDYAAPIPRSATFYDSTVVDGKLDLITVVWSEDVSTIADASAQWTISGSNFAAIAKNGAAPCHSGSADTNECDIPITTTTQKTDVGNLTLVLASGPITDDTIQANQVAGRTFSATATSNTPAFTDGAAPFPTAADLYDSNADGKFDLITTTWSEPLQDVANGTADWTPDSPLDTYQNINEGTVVCSVLPAAANECDYNFTTTSVITYLSGDLTLAYAGTSITDGLNAAAGITFSNGSSPALTDRAAPVIKEIRYREADAMPDGKIDQIQLAFSEPLAATSILSDNDLLLTNVDDFTGAVIGTDASDLILGVVSTVNVNFATEATAQDTSDSGNLALSTQNAFSLVDTTAQANTNTTLGAQTQATIVDQAAPTIKEMKYLDQSGDGRIDAFEATFTETVAAASVLSANSFVFSSGGTDVGDFTGATFGASATDQITADTLTATIPLGTPATAQDTEENSDAIEIDNQNPFSLVDTASTPNTNTAWGGPMDFIVYTDGAAPAPISATFYDTEYDGLLDMITVIWTEEINAIADASSQWASSSAANFLALTESTVTCGGSGAEASNECDYNFTTTTQKTDVGDLTLAYTPGTISDGTNLAAAATFSSASTPAFTDGARPAFVSASANTNTNINIIMSEPVDSVLLGEVTDWNATDITANAVGLNSGTIDLTVDPIANTAYSATDFAFNNSTGPSPLIQDAAGNATFPFSGKSIADGQGATVSAANLSIDATACTGIGGACIIGDQITFMWDNSIATGDANTDVASVTANIAAFGGGASQVMYDDGTHGDTTIADGIYTFLYTVVADDDDAPDSHFGATSTDTSGNIYTAIASTDSAGIDNIAPIINTPGSLAFVPVTGDADSDGVVEIGDTLNYTDGTVTNGDGATFSLDLSLLTGNAAALASANPHTVLPGTINTSYAFTETATDNAGNTVEGFVNALTIDNATGTGFNSASVVLASLITDVSTTATVAFDPSLDLPVDGKIAIVFPAGFDVSGVNLVENLVGLDGTFTIGIVGQTVTLTRNGDGSVLTAGTAASFDIRPITNPSIAGSYVFGLSTKTAADLNLSSSSLVSGATIVAPIPPPSAPPSPNTTVIGGGGGGGGGGGSYFLSVTKKTETSATESEASEQNLHGAARMCTPFYKPSVEPFEGFKDTFGHWAKDYISTIAALGIVQGKTTTQYAPDDPISRAEILKITLNSFNYDIDNEITENPLPDVDINAWYAPFVKTAFKNEIIYGFNAGLSPDTPASRGMVVTILAKAACFEDIQEYFTENYSSHPDYTYAALPDVPITAYYAPYVAYFYDKGIINGYKDGTFGPMNSITRAEVAKIVVNILNKFGIVPEEVTE